MKINSIFRSIFLILILSLHCPAPTEDGLIDATNFELSEPVDWNLYNLQDAKKTSVEESDSESGVTKRLSIDNDFQFFLNSLSDKQLLISQYSKIELDCLSEDFTEKASYLVTRDDNLFELVEIIINAYSNLEEFECAASFVREIATIPVFSDDFAVFKRIYRRASELYLEQVQYVETLMTNDRRKYTKLVSSKKSLESNKMCINYWNAFECIVLANKPIFFPKNYFYWEKDVLAGLPKDDFILAEKCLKQALCWSYKNSVLNRSIISKVKWICFDYEDSFNNDIYDFIEQGCYEDFFEYKLEQAKSFFDIANLLSLVDCLDKKSPVVIKLFEILTKFITANKKTTYTYALKDNLTESSFASDKSMVDPDDVADFSSFITANKKTTYTYALKDNLTESSFASDKPMADPDDVADLSSLLDFKDNLIQATEVAAKPAIENGFKKQIQKHVEVKTALEKAKNNEPDDFNDCDQSLICEAGEDPAQMDDLISVEKLHFLKDRISLRELSIIRTVCDRCNYKDLYKTFHLLLNSLNECFFEKDLFELYFKFLDQVLGIILEKNEKDDDDQSYREAIDYLTRVAKAPYLNDEKKKKYYQKAGEYQLCLAKKDLDKGYETFAYTHYWYAFKYFYFSRYPETASLFSSTTYSSKIFCFSNPLSDQEKECLEKCLHFGLLRDSFLIDTISYCYWLLNEHFKSIEFHILACADCGYSYDLDTIKLKLKYCLNNYEKQVIINHCSDFLKILEGVLGKSEKSNESIENIRNVLRGVIDSSWPESEEKQKKQELSLSLQTQQQDFDFLMQVKSLRKISKNKCF